MALPAEQVAHRLEDKPPTAWVGIIVAADIASGLRTVRVRSSGVQLRSLMARTVGKQGGLGHTAAVALVITVHIPAHTDCFTKVAFNSFTIGCTRTGCFNSWAAIGTSLGPTAGWGLLQGPGQNHWG